MHRTRSLTIGVVTAALASGALSVGVAGAAAHPAHPAHPNASSSVTIHTRHKDFGTFLDANGRTLYLFEKDSKNKSRCSGDCADDWPPLLTAGTPRAGHGVKSGLLGTIKRGNKRQVTYKGHPLYFFAGDSKAGQAHGEGIEEFGAEWYVVNPKGNKIDDDDS